MKPNITVISILAAIALIAGAAWAHTAYEKLINHITSNGQAASKADQKATDLLGSIKADMEASNAAYEKLTKQVSANAEAAGKADQSVTDLLGSIKTGMDASNAAYEKLTKHISTVRDVASRTEDRVTDLLSNLETSSLDQKKLSEHVLATEDAVKRIDETASNILNRMSVKVEPLKAKLPFVTIAVDAEHRVRRTILDSETGVNIGWNIYRDGRLLLVRNAQSETEYTYYDHKPGLYTVYVTTFIDGAYRVISNVIFYEVKPGAGTDIQGAGESTR